MTGSVGIYISVPFCKAKCTFCNFASDVFGAERMQHYVDRLCGEIRGAHAAAERIEASLPRAVDTIYFGGGTPSLLSAQQCREVFQHLRGEFDLDADTEITLECAPGQFADETLDELLRQGMNRISFGVQSFVDQETAAVGRLHTHQQCNAEIARVTAAGIREINVDLIAGLPHQTAQSWQYSVEQAIASGAPHISVYLLEVDEDSRLGREMLKQGSRYSAAAVPDEDQAAEWYQQACDMLHEAGVQQYEISNFARPGHRSRHNLKYWQRQPYIGFGLDAHSMLVAGQEAVRFANTSDLDRYLGQAPEPSSFQMFSSGQNATHAEVDVVGRSEAFEESLFLGLRLNEGVDLDQLRRKFGEGLLQETMPALVEVRDAGLLELHSDRIRLTSQGRLVSNEVFSRLLIPNAA
ncbi:radical SAM family heme chaperone HemW [Tunturibacter empetritectus]|uniref:Heme chaperone HemW n=1 Tax=Tunturiibacter empetritectus TaxID=3069691 RepID=A0A7W8IFF9_9BACT|nr:radical SAM family heme chaperone HemW [Edaphobacter lichenicola]MBB5316027.1 oxygen-independent coproporphyrinogen-3 oxidase [Edaphobacter lichenicola]